MPARSGWTAARWTSGSPTLPTADGLSIATPRGTVRLTQPGVYSIDAGDESDPTRVTAFTGSARMGDSARPP